MDVLKFLCFHCQQMSAMNLTPEGRETVYRFRSDPNETKDLTFYCANCGTANVIALTAQMIEALLHRISSDDTQIQEAIDSAKRGDYNSAINEALRRFKF